MEQANSKPKLSVVAEGATRKLAEFTTSLKYELFRRKL